MKMGRLLAALALAAVLGACQPDRDAALPPPSEPGPDAVGTICQMSLAEHTGPKGQIYLKGETAPLWFSSVRDTFSWLLVDDGQEKAAAAIYVNDMGQAHNWDKPEPGTWVEAHKAVFVVGSRKGASMGGGELVPFGDRTAALHFAAAEGGRVLSFQQVDRTMLAGLTTASADGKNQ